MSTTVTDYDLKSIWVDPSWLFWEFHSEGGESLPRDTAERAYEIHQHACDRLAGNPSELDRVDAITALRRTVAQRVRVLKEEYELRKLPIRSKPKDEMELLTSLEIIRPFMLQRLIDIRNIVEHQDSRPPSVEECLMFADLIWYFLRSTDGLVHIKVDAILLQPPGAEIMEKYPTVELRFEDASRPPIVRLWLNAPGFTYEPNASWMKIEPQKIEGYKEDDETEVSHLYIHGGIRGTEQQMLQMYRLYFRANSLL